MASNDDDISSILTGGVITIYVGPKRKEYQVHKGLLTRYEYWKKHLESDSVKIFRNVYLPGYDPDIWDIFVNWLYRGGLKDSLPENEYMAETQMVQYVRLYGQAERWVIPALQNKIMDKIWDLMTDNWNLSGRNMIQSIYKHTPKGSPLRSYVVNRFLSKSSLRDADCESGGLALEVQLNYDNKEFVLECFEALLRVTPKTEFRAQDRKTVCTYHKHEDGEECSK